MQNKSSALIIALLLIIIGILLYNTFTHSTNAGSPHETESVHAKSDANVPIPDKKQQSIEQLTSETVVVPYVKQNGVLPDYYITKSKARQQGWIPSKGNLCEVLPGRAIGGDIFTNRERSLPCEKGRIWYEADLSYNCSNRNSDRVLFSNDGLVFVTHDHYKTFEEK